MATPQCGSSRWRCCSRPLTRCKKNVWLYIIYFNMDYHLTITITCMYLSTSEAEQLCISSAACLNNCHRNCLWNSFINLGQPLSPSSSPSSSEAEGASLLLNLLQTPAFSLLHDQQPVCLPERLHKHNCDIK